jgi:MFS superfamily sulfate permease-like transporter
LADIQTIVDIHKDLKGAFEKGKNVRLDLGAVTDVDLTFVQLVESTRKFAASEGKTFSVSTPAPEALTDLLKRGGFLATPDDRKFWLGQAGGA